MPVLHQCFCLVAQCGPLLAGMRGKEQIGACAQLEWMGFPCPLSPQRVCLCHSLPFPRQRGTTTWSILQPAGPVSIVCLPSALTLAYILYTQLHTRETIAFFSFILIRVIRHHSRILPAFPSFSTIPSATTIEPTTSWRRLHQGREGGRLDNQLPCFPSLISLASIF